MKPYTTLNLNVIPSHYALTFEPDFKTWTFHGKASIAVSILTATNLIRLHAKELKIHSVSLRSKNKNYPTSTQLFPEKEELAIHLSQKAQGNAELILEFTGIHNDKMYGFYRSRYLLDGKEHHLLTTQFEAANARAAFPCFDEPAFKARFDVSLILPKELMPLSNMPIKKTKSLPQGKQQIWFGTSPKMSTYLLYLGAGKYKFLSSTSEKVHIRVLVTPDNIHLANMALRYTKTFLRFFEDYFKVPYPLPKLDVIAIPDFASGAMENWGAITFREIALLGDKNTSVVIRQNIALTIAHELAHQWFGNLVTMKWWDDLWLNESFATFMSFKAVHAIYPEWEVPLQYFHDTVATALRADQLIATHPINVTVKTPGEIDEIFDAISYDKGGSVLSMLESYVSEAVFRRGLTSYLKKHAYHNATKFDLWNSIQHAYGKEGIVSMVERWITLPGFPVVEVQTKAAGFQLSQRRFTLLGKEFSQSWHIPLKYHTSEGKSKTIILKTKKFLLNEKEWIKLNSGQRGMYRVHYEPLILEKLGSLLQEKKISALDAAGIENDLFALTLARQYTIQDYLTFVEENCVNAGYPLNEGVSAHLSSLFRITYGKKQFESVRKITLIFHRQLLNEIGWQRCKEEKNTVTLLRSMALVALGMAGDQEAQQHLSSLFQSIQKGNKDVDPNIRGAVYGIAAWTRKSSTYHYFLQRYKQESLPEESRKILRSFGMFQDAKLLQQALDLSQSSTVRLQDSMIIPAVISMNPTADVALLWHWTRKNWKIFMKKYGPGTHILSAFVYNLAGADTAELRNEIKTFFARKENFRDDISLAVRQVLERIEINIRFKRYNNL